MVWVIIIVAAVVGLLLLVGILPMLVGPKHLSATDRSAVFREVMKRQREKREHDRARDE